MVDDEGIVPSLFPDDRTAQFNRLPFHSRV
jgi:hypothetical protein